MRDRVLRFGRIALSYVPSRTPRAVAHRLILRANMARDARQWQVGAALYEEALRVAPTSRIHKQCGHMYKEAGQFEAAELHYREAERLAPDDADLAFQIGHFEKIKGDMRAAEMAYRRALMIKPGWDEALEELRRLRPSPDAGSTTQSQMLVPELLPTAPSPAGTPRETIQIRRLGRLARGSDGFRRVLQGVEAIRGFCISSVPLSEIVVLIDGECVSRHSLNGTAMSGGYLKHVFNVWLDFSTMPRGESVVELRLVDQRGRARIHRASAEIVEPAREEDFPDSDAVVDSPNGGKDQLTSLINARASMVRPSQRAPLNGAVDAIFVQRIDQLGDLIVSVPALLRLRELFPHAWITLIVSPANIDFAQTLRVADETLAVGITAQPDGRRAVSREAQQTLYTQLDARRFDLAIDLSQGAESRPLLQLSGAAFTYGFRSATAPWLSASFDLTVPDANNWLEVCSPSRKLLAMIDAIGRMHGPVPLPPLLESAIGASERADRSYILLHAGARLEINRWPFFDQLIALLLSETRFDIVLMGAETSPEAISSDRIQVVNGLLPFSEFDALVRQCGVFVGNDSGPKHLAAIRGVPTISLHVARLNWSEWGQEGRGSIISRRVPCAGCAIEQDPEECGMDFACLRNIRPEEVLAEIIRLESHR